MSGPRNEWCWRIALMALALFAAGSSAMAARMGLGRASTSPLLWGGAAVAAALAVLLLIVACLSRTRFSALLDYAGRVWSSLTPDERQLARPTDREESAGRLLIAVGLAALLINLVVAANAPNDPADDDQGAYLLTAESLNDRGAVLILIVDLLTGQFEEANRHPLYIALLSLKPTLPAGMGWSRLFAGLTWFVAVRWLRYNAGLLPAGICAVLLATNRTLVQHSAMVVCETLLMWTSLMAWVAAARLLRPWPVVIGVALRPDVPAALSTGGWLALTWLTKGTGLLLALGVCLTRGFLTWRDRTAAIPALVRRMSIEIACLALAFAIIGSPLLVRNVRRFGNPFHNVNSQLLFVDEYSDPVALAAESSTSEAAVAYWQSHSWSQLLAREADGLVWETFLLLRSLGPVPWDDFRVLPGAVLLLLAIIGAAGCLAYPRLLTAVWTLLLVVVFAWYVPIAAGERFLVPVLAPLLMAASIGAVRAVQRLVTTPQAATRWIVGGTIAWSVVTTAAHFWWGLV